MNRRLSPLIVLLIPLTGVTLGLALLIVPIKYFTHVVLFLVSGFVFAISAWLMQKAIRAFDLHRLTIPSFWYFSYLAINVIPGFLIFYGVDFPDYSFRVRPGSYLNTYLAVLLSNLITVPLGILLVSKLLRFKTDEIRQYFARPLEERPARALIFLVILGGIAGLAGFYVLQLETLPVIEMFRDPGDYAYLAALREESLAAINSPLAYVFSVLREAIMPFMVCIAIGSYLCSRKPAWLILLLFTFFFAVLIASISIAKGPVATIFMVAAAFLYLYRVGRFRITHAVLAFGAILSFPFLVFRLASPAGWGFWDSVRAIFIRLFYAPAYVANVYFDVVPREVEFQYGATVGKVAWLFGLKYFNMGHYVLQRIYPHALPSGSAGGVFFADFYTNFGMPGVCVGGFLLGGIMQAIQILIIKRKKTIAGMASYAFLFYAFWMTTSRALPTVLLSTGVIFVLLAWAAYVLVDKILQGAGGKHAMPAVRESALAQQPKVAHLGNRH